MKVPQHAKRGLYFVVLALCLDVIVTSLSFYLIDILEVVMALAGVQAFLALVIISIEVVLLTDTMTWRAGNQCKAFQQIQWAVLATATFAALSIAWLVMLLLTDGKNDARYWNDSQAAVVGAQKLTEMLHWALTWQAVVRLGAHKNYSLRA
eukprot:m.124271 g.124271  ORF g.124271 m.124271 type:complete len:151 (+) comp15700_c0_seq2:1930-2382(+)